MTDDLKMIRIKTSVVERILKELKSYQTELNDNKREIEKIRVSDDHSKLKQWENVLGETQAMVPDTKNRLTQAAEDLRNFVDQTSSSGKLSGTPEHQKSLSMLSKVVAALED